MKMNASPAVLPGCESNICKGHRKAQQDQKAKVLSSSVVRFCQLILESFSPRCETATVQMWKESG